MFFSSAVSKVTNQEKTSQLVVDSYISSLRRENQINQKSVPLDLIEVICSFWHGKFLVSVIDEEEGNSERVNEELFGMAIHPDDIFWMKVGGVRRSHEHVLVRDLFGAAYVLSSEENTSSFLASGVEVISEGATAEHTLLMQEEGEVLAFGRNNYGQCCKGQISSWYERVHVEVPEEIFSSMSKVVQIAAGEFHTLFLCEDGRVHGCGGNFRSQLGLPHTRKVITVPQRIPELEGVTKIVTGDYHSFCVTGRNWVFTFGCNNNGQCGLKELGLVQRPTLFEAFPSSKKINAVFCGYSNSAIIDEQSNSYLFGKNHYGRIGNGCKKSDTNICSPYLLPIKCELISLAYDYTLFLSVENEVFFCGKDIYGWFFPKSTQVFQPALVKKEHWGLLEKDKIVKIIARSNQSIVISQKQ